MKKLLLLLFAIGWISICEAQQFSFQMRFVDAVGNLDSITLGYDPAATDSLDTFMGEVNIITTPYASGLDVRTGNEWFFSYSLPFTPWGIIPFESKKQIVPDVCGTGNFWLVYPLVEIDIVSTHFPVKAYWKKDPFNDPCRNGSVFTGVHPGGWWDTGGFRTDMHSTDSVTFYQNQYYYLKGADTVNVYWFAFSDSTLLSLGINEISPTNYSAQICPNPASDRVSLRISNSFGEIDCIEFYNGFGQIVLTSKQIENINIGRLNTGLYFVKVRNSKGLEVITKLQKI